MFQSYWHEGGVHLMMWWFWIPVLFLIFWLVIRFLDAGNRRPRRDTPVDILRKRYARGEITTEEYQERKKVLESEDLGR